MNSSSQKLQFHSSQFISIALKRLNTAQMAHQNLTQKPKATQWLSILIRFFVLIRKEKKTFFWSGSFHIKNLQTNDSWKIAIGLLNDSARHNKKTKAQDKLQFISKHLLFFFLNHFFHLSAMPWHFPWRVHKESKSIKKKNEVTYCSCYCWCFFRCLF